MSTKKHPILSNVKHTAQNHFFIFCWQTKSKYYTQNINKKYTKQKTVPTTKIIDFIYHSILLFKMTKFNNKVNKTYNKRKIMQTNHQNTMKYSRMKIAHTKIKKKKLFDKSKQNYTLKHVFLVATNFRSKLPLRKLVVRNFYVVKILYFKNFLCLKFN